MFAWFSSRLGKNNAGAGNQKTGAPVVIDTVDMLSAPISGPFSSGNLSVFFIHGTDSTKLSNFLTLEEALAEKKVVIKETSNVCRLLIQNVGTQEVFIQSGDIIRGGKQDRAVQYDMILPAKSGEIAINAFCVERGRWCKRGREDDTHFGQSNHYMSSKPMRMAAKYSSSQQEVWNEVAKMQYRSAMNAHVPLSKVQGEESPSSLQLTLDNETIKKMTQSYVDALVHTPDGQSDIVGYAFAINGQINSIDVYAANALFSKMWEKLLRAGAVEAFSELKEGEEFAPATSDDVRACMDEVRSGKAEEKVVAGKGKTLMQESSKNVLFETRDMDNEDRWVHRSYATK